MCSTSQCSIANPILRHCVPLLQQYRGEAEQYCGEVEKLKEELKAKKLQLQSAIQTGEGVAKTNQTLNDELTHRKQQLEVSMIEYSVLMASYQPFFLK